MNEKPDSENELALMAIWDKGNIIFQHRTHKDGGIGFFGGRLKVGEDPMDGALREILEETEAQIEPGHVSFIRKFESDGWVIHAFQVNRNYIVGSLENTEGEPIPLSPLAAYRHDKIMPATKVVLRESILFSDGPIDN